MNNSFRDGTLWPAIGSFLNEDIQASRSFLTSHLHSWPEDCLAHAIRAAVEFYETVFEWVLSGGELSAARLLRNHRMDLDDDRRELIMDSLERAERLAKRALTEDETVDMGTFTLSLVSGIRRDYDGLVRNHWIASLTHAQEANLLGRNLLKANPNAHDAYCVFALSEYLISRVPAAARPFAKIPGITGNRSKAIQFCIVASKTGCYYREIAMCLLVVLYTEEDKPGDALGILSQLADRFPNNSTITAELQRRQKIAKV